MNINGLPIASYTHNALGQRTHKHTPYDGSTTYLYGQDGQLLGWTRYSAASAQQPGQPTQAQYYLWLGSQPIAAVQVGYNSLGSITSTDVLYLHTDHLDTPRLATNASQTVVWKLPPHEPFGTAQAQQDPDQDGMATDIPLRFAGQVFDADTGLHYNYFRDYDPWTGRYIQSDPIGLAGGPNGYLYAGANPLSFTDPMGLKHKANSAHCSALRKKMQNLRNDLDDRWSDLAADRLNLPKRLGPGELLSQTKRGHRTMINDRESNLRKFEKRYSDECEDDDDNGSGQSCDTGCAAVGAAATVGAGYVAYRCLRMLPSLFPPLWPTIPANVVVP